MRKLLLAGVALAGVSAFLSTAAQAQSPVFNETSTPGKLDGAAPNSVTINIGFQQLTAIMGEGGTGASGLSQRAFPQLFNWFHMFPSMDYANPSGIHFGVTAEIRNNNSGQGNGNGGNTFYVHSANAYVSSDKFGKFTMGTANGALDDLGVGTGDDWGDGLFYSWYGPPNAPPFAMADSYDGDTPRQKLTYETPSFSGFKAGISYQPTDVALDHSTSLTTGDPGTTTITTTCPPGGGPCVGVATTTLAHPAGLARNRVEAAVQFNKAFGAFGVKADLGWAGAGTEANAANISYKNVSYGNFGLVLTYAGVELEGSVSSGSFTAGPSNVMSPGSPSLSGSKNSTVYIAGLGYNMGPFGVGAVYYGMSYDDSQGGNGNLPGVASDTVWGVGLGGSYVVGPGVTLQLDAYGYQTKLPTNQTTGALGFTTHGSIVALASQFAF